MPSLHFFPPELFPDESFASLVARTAEYCALHPNKVLVPSDERDAPQTKGNSRASSRKGEVLNFRFANKVIPFVKRLSCPDLDAHFLTQNHCIYPFYAPFIDADARWNHLNWAMRLNPRHDSSLGKKRGRPPSPIFARLCPECVRNDIQEYHEAYYHRRHQLPGLNLCLEHKLVLQPVNSKLIASKPISARAALESTTLTRESVNLPSSLTKSLSHSLDVLFTRDPFWNPPANWISLYSVILRLGYSKKPVVEQILSQIEDKYGPSLEIAFQFSTWKSSLVRYLGTSQGHLPPPIAHLILLAHLGLPLNEALSLAQNSLWTCPNRFCDCYEQFTLTAPISTGQTYELSCKECEMGFRIKKESELGKKPIIRFVTKRGKSFETKLTKLFKDGLSADKIAPLTGFSERLIRAMQNELGLSKHKIKSQTFEKHFAATFAAYRSSITEWVRQNPSGSRSELCQAHAMAYRYLRSHDVDWFEKNAPKPRHEHLSNRGKRRLKE